MSKVLHVNLGENSYDIVIEAGLLRRTGEMVQQVTKGKKVFVVTDENVGSLYSETVIQSLRQAGFTTDLVMLKPGEATKSFATLPILYNRMLDFKLNRSELVVALGGGVIGDLAGFAASTYLRGVSFVQIPTSLLAQTDSSVGGKVAVDLERGKNLVGSFYQPKMVLIDPIVLNTLSDHFFRDGMAEVIKYGCIKDAALFRRLAELGSREAVMQQIEEIIWTCCDIKRQVVEADERDLGERMLLNFGHTLGHAIEKYYDFSRYSHGEAVAIGMYMIAQLGEAKQLTKAGTAEKIKRVLEKFGLPIAVEIERFSEFLDTILLDKKNLGNKLNIVLLREIGNSFIHATTADFLTIDEISGGQ